ncbi:MAG: 2-keto-4-pentenoate hydratase [Chloroflexota bacterium]
MTTLSHSVIRSVAEELLEAERTHVPIAALSERHPGATYDDAYAIQMLTVNARVESGARITGAKTGFTSKAMQEQFNVPEPDSGVLFDYMVWREGAPVNMDNFISPRVEAEIAFVLGSDLAGPGVNAAQALQATAGVMPSLEVLDSRFKDWKITIIDSMADDAEACGIVLGGALVPVAGLDLRTLGVVFEKNGEVVSTGAGAAALGNPAEALAWVANKFASLGLTLRKGQVVISGSLIRALNVERGDSFRASFDRLGPVSVRFE